MSRCLFAFLLLLMVLTGGRPGGPALFAGEAPRPHIIILLADDLGWNDVSYHGSKIKTPHIDLLAEEGVRLEQFYVQPLCSPTRAALMTGRYPMRYGLQCGVVRPWADYGLPLDERTLPQALRSAGYRTAIVGKWHLGHVRREYLPTQRGFDWQYGHYNGMLDYYTHIRDGGHDWHRNDKANYDKGYTTNLIAAEAVRILATHNKQQPLFLYVPFNAPHTPLQAPDEYIRRYAHIADKRRRIYAAMVACLDEAVGRIRAALKEHDYPPEKTLVFFCSDNGGIPRFGSNHPLRAGKGTLYEGGVRVPAVILWKNVLPPGKTVSEPLHIVDLFPTLVRLAGGKTASEKPLDGKDIWPVLTQGKPSPHAEIVHNVTPFHAALRSGEWKLIHNGHVSAAATRLPKKEQWELFNLPGDLSERQNVKDQHPDVFRRLRKRIDALRREMASPHIAPNRMPANFRVPRVWGETAP